MTTAVDQSNQENNQFRAIVSESEHNSEDSKSASVTLARHTDYIREVQADQDRLLSAAQLQVNDKDDDWETDTDNMLKWSQSKTWKVSVQRQSVRSTTTTQSCYRIGI